MKQLLSLLLVISVHVMPAQDTMTCLQQLDTVIDAVSRNYAGFHDKVTPSTRTTYGALLDSLRTGAVGSSRVDLQACKLEYSIVSPK